MAVNFETWKNEKTAVYYRTSQQRKRKKGEETKSQEQEVLDWLDTVPEGAIAPTTKSGFQSKGKSNKITDYPLPLEGKLQIFDDGQQSGFDRVSDLDGTIKRPALDELLKVVSAGYGTVDKVLIVSPDRLANDAMLFGRYADELREWGAELVDLSSGFHVTDLKAGEDYDLSEVGQNTMLMLFSGAAEMQKKSQAAKTRSGVKVARKKGKCSGSMQYMLTKDYLDLERVIRQYDEDIALLKSLPTNYARKKYRKGMKDTNRPRSYKEIATRFEFGKTKPDDRAVRNWRDRFKLWRDKGVLDEWMATMKSMQDLRGMMPDNDASRAIVLEALTNNSCFLLYPSEGESPFKGEVYEPETREKILQYAMKGAFANGLS